MPDDRDLARLFEGLRRADEASAPPLNDVLDRKRTGRGATDRFAVLRVAALAALLVGSAVVAVLVRRPAGETADREPPVTLAQWKSPTDWLLRTPGSERLGQVPALPDSVPTYTGFEDTERVRGETPRPR